MTIGKGRPGKEKRREAMDLCQEAELANGEWGKGIGRFSFHSLSTDNSSSSGHIDRFAIIGL